MYYLIWYPLCIHINMPTSFPCSVQTVPFGGMPPLPSLPADSIYPSSLDLNVTFTRMPSTFLQGQFCPSLHLTIVHWKLLFFQNTYHNLYLGIYMCAAIVNGLTLRSVRLTSGTFFSPQYHQAQSQGLAHNKRWINTFFKRMKENNHF